MSTAPESSHPCVLHGGAHDVVDDQSCPHSPLLDALDIVTVDGKIVRRGDRVWSYYDGAWGTIVGDPDDEGWFAFEPEGRRKRCVLNGERIAASVPDAGHYPDVRWPDVTVELIGADGNALAVLGLVKRALRDAGAPREEIDAFLNEATSGDYAHLLATVQAWVEVR